MALGQNGSRESKQARGDQKLLALRFRVPEEERTATVRLEGGLDIYRRGEIISRLPEPGTVDRVIIDCTNATSIDSTILSALMRYRRSFASAGGDPVNIVVVVEPSLRRIFEIAGLSRVLTIVSAPGRPTAAPENVKDPEPT